MTMRLPRMLTSGALAVAMAVSGVSFAPSAQAMPAKPIGLNEGAPSLVEAVRYRRRAVRARRNNAAGAAIALGVLGLAAGAAIAASQEPRYHYYYGDPYYAAPYYAAPRYHYGPRRGYYGPRYSYGHRWHGGRRWNPESSGVREHPDSAGR